jgi:small subunit ribosomal protein S8
MSQDIVADALNELMNAKKAKKTSVVVKRHSKLLRNVLDIAKNAGYLDYSIDGNEMTIEIKELHEIKAIKPRFTVSVKKINHYTRRFLPAKNFGFIIISTNQGLMKGNEAEEKKLGG